MLLRGLLAVLAALALAGAAAASPRVVVAPQVSSNWSGYVARSPAAGPKRSFTRASGSWRVPRVACSKSRPTSAAFWVGIGGYGARSPALEQLGSSADCDPSGTASYRLWTEIVPAPARFLSMRVAPGDTIAASVDVSGRTVTLRIENRSRGTHYSTQVHADRALDTSSAEWIAEAPSLCRTPSSCDVVPLSNFGVVGFNGITATSNGHTGALADPAWATTPVVLVTSKGARSFSVVSNASGAVPARYRAAGRAFTVQFRPSIFTGVPPSPLAGAPLPDWVH